MGSTKYHQVRFKNISDVFHYQRNYESTLLKMIDGVSPNQNIYTPRYSLLTFYQIVPISIYFTKKATSYGSVDSEPIRPEILVNSGKWLLVQTMISRRFPMM